MNEKHKDLIVKMKNKKHNGVYQGAVLGAKTKKNKGAMKVIFKSLIKIIFNFNLTFCCFHSSFLVLSGSAFKAKSLKNP